MPEVRLTPEAEAKLARLEAVLAELGLTPEQALALSLARGMAKDLDVLKQEDPDSFQLAGEADTLSYDWLQDSDSAWADVLREIPQYLTDK
jgi:hypothetical protein